MDGDDDWDRTEFMLLASLDEDDDSSCEEEEDDDDAPLMWRSSMWNTCLPSIRYPRMGRDSAYEVGLIHFSLTDVSDWVRVTFLTAGGDPICGPVVMLPFLSGPRLVLTSRDESLVMDVSALTLNV